MPRVKPRGVSVETTSWSQPGGDALKRRRDERTNWRVPCDLVTVEGRHTGIALDFSRTGLFVQTAARIALGSPVHVLLFERDGARIELEAQVVRKRNVPSRLSSVASGGVGLRLAQATEDYYRFFAKLTGEHVEMPDGDDPATFAEPDTETETGTGASASASAEPSFRVRARQCSSPRSRTLVVTGEDAEQARQRALGELGDGWAVLEVTPA